ncbi:hypothetical protein P389DRAFT_88887 [Cystobasidium minutum MCA 4210]|uniref:uncharacterized protein n=1 Tax=Cystobasidium minutum MCA 4210 TaxID=1397322 RepID=UPI0034CED757|eukprot:jgi/Rhomi1/88887/CE88886_51
MLETEQSCFFFLSQHQDSSSVSSTFGLSSSSRWRSNTCNIANLPFACRSCCTSEKRHERACRRWPRRAGDDKVEESSSTSRPSEAGCTASLSAERDRCSCRPDCYNAPDFSQTFYFTDPARLSASSRAGATAALESPLGTWYKLWTTPWQAAATREPP